MPVREFHTGPYETVVGPAEMLTEIRVPIRPGCGSAYEKVERRAGDWAVAAAGAAVWLDGDTSPTPASGSTAVGAEHFRAPPPRTSLAASRPPTTPSTRPPGSPAEGCRPAADQRGPADYKRHLAERADPPGPAPRRRPGAGREADMQVTITVNGEDVTREIEPRLLLVHFLRDDLGLTGTHWGCDTSNCGTCVVWLDGEPVKSCTVLAAMADGHAVRTVEDLEHDGVLDPVQQGFMEEHGLQCGFCTPGHDDDGALAARPQPRPDEAEIREAISGQICRCTGYENIVRSVRWAADAPARGGRDHDRAKRGPRSRSVVATKWRHGHPYHPKGAPMTVTEDRPNPIGFGRMLRKEDARFIRGKGNYVDDVELPGMLHGAVLRSPFAHARIVSIDTSAAEAHPKVRAVITGATLETLEAGVDADAVATT